MGPKSIFCNRTHTHSALIITLDVLFLTDFLCYAILLSRPKKKMEAKYSVEACKYVISFSENRVHGFRIFLLPILSSSVISISGFSCLDELLVRRRSYRIWENGDGAE